MPILDFWETVDYPRIEINNVRYYDIGGLLYPSVTTVTSAYGNDKIKEWKNKVGEDNAQKISELASKHGTHIHYLSEQYLSRDYIDKELLNCWNRSSLLQNLIFAQFKSSLDKISVVYLLENTLYSHKLKLAGTVDCVGVFDNKLSIIDFKTSKHQKPEEWIESYYVQTCIYAMMVKEIYGIEIKQLVLMFACQDLTTPIVVKKIDKQLLNLVKTYINYYRNLS